MSVRTARRACAASMLGSGCALCAATELTFSEQADAAGLVVVPDRPYTVQGCYAAATAGDFNRDGWQDLFVPTGGYEPDKLFINRGGGRFADEAVAWGIADPHLGVSAAAGDFNRDGWLDLFVVSRGELGNERPGAHRLYRNNGDGTFTDIADTAGVRFTSPAIPDGFGAAFGDFDLDGDLDLAVAGYYVNAGGNRLFRNNGDETFTDVTAVAIRTDLTPVRGFSPRFVDMNGDRWPELLWVGDFRTTRYLANDGTGRFDDLTVAAGVGREGNGMGQTVGDFNRDGLPDWYVTSIFEPFAPIGAPNGNMLYLNLGGHRFAESAEDWGVQHGGWGWGAASADFDHDGHEDLVAVNGWYTLDFLSDRARVFRNRGDARFDEIGPDAGIDVGGQQRGLLHWDYDNDGDQDLVLMTFREPLRLFRNDLPPGPERSWLHIQLDTSRRAGLAPDGVGAVVVVQASGERQMRVIDAGCNYISQDELSAHVGLGGATIVESLRIEWPDGRVTTLTDVAPNQRLRVAVRLPGDVDANDRVDLADLSELLASLDACEGVETYRPPADLDGDGCVALPDLLDLLAHFGLRAE